MNQRSWPAESRAGCVHDLGPAFSQDGQGALQVRRDVDRAREIVAGAEGQQTQLCPPEVRRKSVDHLVERAVAAGGDDQLGAGRDGLLREGPGVARFPGEAHGGAGKPLQGHA